MSKIINLTDQRFGRLTIISRSARRVKSKNAIWLCRCECGKFTEAESYNLRTGHTKSCGCLIPDKNFETSFKHGLIHTSEYSIWGGMIQRCTNSNLKHFKYYGGRGIRVCDRWLNSFENFYSDVGPKPFPEASIERIDVNGNYEPSNCKWIHILEQAKNKRPRV